MRRNTEMVLSVGVICLLVDKGLCTNRCGGVAFTLNWASGLSRDFLFARKYSNAVDQADALGYRHRLKRVSDPSALA